MNNSQNSWRRSTAARTSSKLITKLNIITDFVHPHLIRCARFWESVQSMKALPQSAVKEAVNNIWKEYLGPDAQCPVNVDSKSVELARQAVQTTGAPNRWCFDVAASHVYHLMKSDSYSRYLRSDMYKEYLNGSKKKVKSIPNLFGVKR